MMDAERWTLGGECPSDACKIEIHATGFGEGGWRVEYFGSAPSGHSSRKYLAVPLSQLFFMWEAEGCRLIDCCWQMNVIQIPLCLALCLGRSLLSFQPCHPTLPRLASPRLTSPRFGRYDLPIYPVVRLRTSLAPLDADNLITRSRSNSSNSFSRSSAIHSITPMTRQPSV